MVHALDSPDARRVKFDLERVLRTDYHIDRYQDTYFVIDSFERLLADTRPDFTPIYARVRTQPVLAPDAHTPRDTVVA